MKDAKLRDFEAKVKDLEAKLALKETKIRDLEMSTLPMQVTKQDIKVSSIDGPVFLGHEDFIKQTIIKAFASSKLLLDTNKKSSCLL